MIVSVGEVVWDIFPQRQVLGGAPLNVAYHLSCMGLPVMLLSRIGHDELGVETRRHIKKLGLSTDCLQVDEGFATGRVLITVDENNEPHYDIVEPAAWDNISATSLDDLIPGDFSLVFGTLGQRNKCTRQTIKSLCQRADYRFYDVNLRPPFTTKELVAESLDVADMVKVNGDELLIMGQWFGIAAKEKIEIARALANVYNLEFLVVTEGASGAWLLAGSEVFSVPGKPVQVADTVGAGDAFFAALIAGFLQKTPWQECLDMANSRGGYVASQNGATPPMGEFK